MPEHRWCYHPRMTVKKRSVSFDNGIHDAIRAAAADSGQTFSAWVNDAAAHQLRLREGRLGISEWEAEHGPLTAEEKAVGSTALRDLLRAT